MSADIIPFPFSRLPREYAINRAAALAADSAGDAILIDPVDDSVRMVVGGCELWFSIDEFSDMTLKWAQRLADHSARLLEKAEENEPE